MTTTADPIAAPTYDDIVAAHERIRPYVHRTPVVVSRLLDAWVGHSVVLKTENLQRVGAFKIRGATNAVLTLPSDAAGRGVAAHSSGNHAAALAQAAHTAGIPAYIVMPEDAPQVKVDAVRGYGAEITFCDTTIESRTARLTEVLERTGATEIHPYDDPAVIAGQGTAAIELLEDAAQRLGVRLDAIVAPIGGGGLISGVSIAAHALQPDIEIIGAEPRLADDAARSLDTGQMQPPLPPQTVADGLRTGLSERTFAVIRDHVSTIVTVSEEEIVEATRFAWMRTKLVIEPSGAVPIAAVRKLGAPHRTIGVIVSGGNVDIDALPW